MAIRSLLFLVMAAALFSFKGSRQSYVNFFNMTSGETGLQSRLATPEHLAYAPDSGKKFSIYDEGVIRKDVPADPADIKMIRDWTARLQYDPGLFRRDVPFSVYAIGDIQLREKVETRLFYIEAADKANDRELKLLMGVNIVNGQVVSIIELSRNLLLLGFSNATYSIWHNNKFKIVHPIASCVSGPGVKHSRPDSRTVKMGADGKLD